MLEILQQEQRVLVSELSHKYQVTEETIRRDLDKLEKEGFVKKTYGGAVLNNNTNAELPLRIREQVARREKIVISKIVAGIIEEGDTVMLDSSSTSLVIARALKQFNKLTVITNSVEVLLELAGSSVEVISTGGNLMKSSLSLVGQTGQNTLSRFNVDKTILSCKGISMEEGLTDSNEQEAVMKNNMRRSSAQLIIAVDHNKFDRISFVQVLELRSGDIVVTDQKPDEKWLAYFEKKHVTVLFEH
ncbi:MAG: DeoR/GlpR family DNA-binding transcription regulator [Lachnospiraceae bacterium]|nr:DeoR/GlpR family DNA-binding transcription regulator [Lachnospiraceae bacterium]